MHKVVLLNRHYYKTVKIYYKIVFIIDKNRDVYKGWSVKQNGEFIKSIILLIINKLIIITSPY